MSEATKKILAYQRGPLIITCLQSGSIPDDFLINLTEDEKAYLDERTKSSVEPIFYELLPKLGAAGILSNISPLLVDVHSKNPSVASAVDSINLPLAEDLATKKFLVTEYSDRYRDSLNQLVAKTQQKFGVAHVVHISLLPHFFNGRQIPYEVVTFGNDSLEGATHEPEELASLYDNSIINDYELHTWVGLNRKLFSTSTLRKELVDRLSRVKTKLLA